MRGNGREMEQDLQGAKKPLEIDIHKILIQLGIESEKWPEEFKKPVKQF
jgi:hypothetical protein